METKVNLFTALVFLLAFAIAVALFFPGHINGDAGYIYRCATGAYPCEDWHSPTISIIWGWCTLLWDSPASIMLLIVGLLFSGLTIIAITAPSIGARSYWLLIVLVPPVFLHLGLITKDTLSTSLIVYAVSLLVYDTTRKVRHKLILALSLLLFLVAALVKISAVFAIAPLASYVAVRLFSSKPLLRSYWIIFVSSLIFGLTFYAGLELAKYSVNAKKSWVSNAVYLFDLVGMSSISGEDLLTGYTPKDRNLEEDQCYEPLTWDGLAWGKCRYVTQYMFKTKVWESYDLRTRWFESVTNNPSIYLEHRMNHFYAFSTTIGKSIFLYHYEDLYLPKANQNLLMDHLHAFSKNLGVSRFLFFPVTWLYLSLLLLILSLTRVLQKENNGSYARSNWSTNLVLCLAASNVIFYLTLFFFGLAYDFRYSNTVIWQTLIALGLLMFPPMLNDKANSNS